MWETPWNSLDDAWGDISKWWPHWFSHPRLAVSCCVASASVGLRAGGGVWEEWCDKLEVQLLLWPLITGDVSVSWHCLHGLWCYHRPCGETGVFFMIWAFLLPFSPSIPHTRHSAIMTFLRPRVLDALPAFSVCVELLLTLLKWT